MGTANTSEMSVTNYQPVRRHILINKRVSVHVAAARGGSCRAVQHLRPLDPKASALGCSIFVSSVYFQAVGQ
jgi:hypothetical protein